MGMTITEKILAAHADKKGIEPGEIVETRIDLALANDITAPLSLEEFAKVGAKKVFDPEKVVFVLDHFTPNKDIISAENCKKIREFSKRYNITHCYEGGNCGIEHALLPEEGLVVAGDLVIGADSHTCTYGALGCFSTGMGSTDAAAAMATGKTWLRVPDAILVKLTGRPHRWVGGKDLIINLIGILGVDGATYASLEFDGPGVENVSVEGRLTAANMVIEAGAKNGIFPADAAAVEFLRGVGVKASESGIEPDEHGYLRQIDIDLSAMEPQVALPSLPSSKRWMLPASGARKC